MNASASARDFEPPHQPPTARPPWVLHLGYDLEEIYCHYAELQMMIAQGLPNEDVDRMRQLGGWVLDRLRELGITDDLIKVLEQALAGLTRQEDYRRVASNPDWVAHRARMGERLEQVMAAVEDAVEERGRRYYDYGVMLCRIELCAAMVRIAPQLPEPLANLLPDLLPMYRKELMRATAVLQAYVTDDSPSRPRDPEQGNLDRMFDAFAQYLATWRTGDAEPDDRFLQHLGDDTHSSGFFRASGRFAPEIQPIRRPEPQVPHERMPLPVPHRTEDRERLASLWKEAQAIAQEGDLDRYLERLRLLVQACRYCLGPVHPLTLHVQLSLAAAHSMTGQTGTACLMACDVADAAWYYYGARHPFVYLITIDAHSLLKLVAPDTAQQLYDSRLKYLVETDETELGPWLHEVRRTLRQVLGMAGEDTERTSAN
jgi:hypothetical protein